jgi:hypothetical protein
LASFDGALNALDPIVVQRTIAAIGDATFWIAYPQGHIEKIYV